MLERSTLPSVTDSVQTTRQNRAMTPPPTGIRNAVRALIMQNRQVLLLRKGGDERGERYALPGGGQEPGESLIDALQRECREEIGTTVIVDELLIVADYSRARSLPKIGHRQLVEFLFRCRLPDGYRPTNGPQPDRHQLAVTWVTQSAIASLPLTPGFLRQPIATGDFNSLSYAGAFSDHVRP
jgi:8-oxo-dGTP diphosphatase